MVATVALTMACVSPAAAGTAKPVYAGGSKPGNRYIEIAMQLLAGRRAANWQVNVYGPCSEPDIRLSESIGTDGGYHDPRLKIRNGHFRLRRHTFVPGDHTSYRYTLSGHATRGGFAGTFTYSQTTETSEYTVTCSVPLLRWRAQRSKRPFP